MAKKPKQNELQSIQKKTDKRMRAIYPPIIDDIINVDTWDDVSRQVHNIFIENEYRGKVETVVLQGSVNGTAVGLGTGLAISSTDELTNYYLQIPYKGSKLSKRLHLAGNEAERVITDVVKQNIKANTNWKKLAKDIGKKTNTVGDVAKVIQDLGKQGNAYIRGSLSAKEIREFNSKVKQAQKYVSGLSKGHAPTKQLKKAYQDVINAVQGKSDKVLNNTITKAFQRKIDYNNQRISRTELSRAHSLSFHRRIEEDPDVIGYRVVLSPQHPLPDQCDCIASVNNGAGAGVYLKGDNVTTPIHPFCLCDLEPYVDDRKPRKYSNKAAKEYLNSVDDKTREKIIGVNNAKYKSRWQDGLEARGIAKDSWKKKTMLPKNLVRESEDG